MTFSCWMHTNPTKTGSIDCEGLLMLTLIRNEFNELNDGWWGSAIDRDAISGFRPFRRSNAIWHFRIRFYRRIFECR